MAIKHPGVALLCSILFLTGISTEIFAVQPSGLSGPSEPAVRRYGLFVGANDGGKDRVLLRYAESDALAVSEVLQRTGGLDPYDMLLLKDPSREEILKGIREIDGRIRRSGNTVTREEFIFYYSGHSDESGLLLGRDRFEYRELRDELKGVGADVHIAILDSCSSGAFTRLKGGMRRSPFLFDESTEASGHAFLTSSSASEAAQESDEIGGSFFTHYFISALSGAADTSQDRRVSLNEAYSFASEETLARTEHTLAGPQHASYDINLTGTGDLVLTDLRSGVEKISFSESVAGRVSIRDDREKLVLEMRKQLETPVTITLPPGFYSITLDDGVSLKTATISLGSGALVHVDQQSFRRLYREPTVPRGPGYETGYEAGYGAGPGEASYSGVDVDFVGYRRGPMDGIQIGLVGNILEGNMEGIQLSSVFSIVEGSMEGVQLSGVFNLVEGSVEGPQIGGVFNITEGDVEGPQLAGVFNIGEGRVEGPQVAGVFNIAEGEKSSGIQVAGTFNLAENFEGLQFGVVNIAGSMTGIQTGVVNIADDLNGIPVGLVNIIGNGLHHLSAWYDQDGMMNFGFQLGTGYYTYFTGAVPLEDLEQAFSAGIGMGIEMPLGRFYFDTEVYAKTYAEHHGSFNDNISAAFDGTSSPFPAVRLSFGRNIAGKSAFFAGVDMAVHVRDYTDFVPGVMEGDAWSLDYSGSGDYMDFYPTWFFGCRF